MSVFVIRQQDLAGATPGLQRILRDLQNFLAANVDGMKMDGAPSPFLLRGLPIASIITTTPEPQIAGSRQLVAGSQVTLTDGGVGGALTVTAASNAFTLFTVP